MFQLISHIFNMQICNTRLMISNTDDEKLQSDANVTDQAYCIPVFWFKCVYISLIFLHYCCGHGPCTRDVVNLEKRVVWNNLTFNLTS